MDFGAHVDQGGSRTYQEIGRTIMKQEGPIKQDGPISQASPAVAGPDFQVSACLRKTAAQGRFFVVSALEARFGDQGPFLAASAAASAAARKAANAAASAAAVAAATSETAA